MYVKLSFVVLAFDGSVCLVKRANIARYGEGEIVHLDMIHGIHGFILSGELGRIYFNINTVRPAANKVNTVFKLGQKVQFRAIPTNNPNQNNKWRATLVRHHVQEFQKCQPMLPFLSSTHVEPSENEIVPLLSDNKTINKETDLQPMPPSCWPERLRVSFNPSIAWEKYFEQQQQQLFFVNSSLYSSYFSTNV